MSTDIERELRQLGHVMLTTSTPITTDEVTRHPTPALSVQRATGVPLERGRRHRPDPRARPHRPWLAAAVVAIVVAGIAAVWAVSRNDTATPPAPADQPTAPAPATKLPPGQDGAGGTASGVAVPEPGTATTAEPLVQPIPVVREQAEWAPAPWDDIAVAPGSVGFYDVDTAELPDDLSARLGTPTVWDTSYLMNFFRCPTWEAAPGSVTDGTIDATGITCTGIEGGYREVVEFGDSLSIGSGIGRSDWTNNTVPTIETLLTGLADGSLWGYETHATPPEPTLHDIDGVAAVSYLEGDHSYLVLEPTPGTFAWLHGRGLDDADLEAVARALRPVELPATVPVPIVLGPDVAHPTANGTAQMKMVWLNGQPCVGLQIEMECTPADAGPAIVTGGIGTTGQQPAVAAIVPAGQDYQLTVALFGMSEWQEVPPAFSGLGITTHVYVPDNERLFAARLTDPNSDEIAAATWGIDSMINGFAPDLVAEGRTDGIAWVVVRQDPAWDGVPPMVTYRGGGYCLLLFEAGGGWAPMCPPADPPTSGLGVDADYHDDLNLIEAGPDVTSLNCGDVPLDIITDDHLDNRRFVITTCDNPTR